jgi:hypothetical protein
MLFRKSVLAWWKTAKAPERALTVGIIGLVLLVAVDLVTSRRYRFAAQWDAKRIELAPAGDVPRF